MSLILFTPAQWDKIPDPIMSDLIDHGFYPPTSNRRPSRARVEEDCFSDFSPLVLSYPVSENDLAHGLFGSDSFRFDDVDPTTEEAIEEQGWAIDMGLLNPLAAPAVDDGNLPSMTPTQHREWQAHVQHGHLKKSHLCRGCILAEGLDGNAVLDNYPPRTPCTLTWQAPTPKRPKVFSIFWLGLCVWKVFLFYSMSKCSKRKGEQRLAQGFERCLPSLRVSNLKASTSTLRNRE